MRERPISIAADPIAVRAEMASAVMLAVTVRQVHALREFVPFQPVLI